MWPAYAIFGIYTWPFWFSLQCVPSSLWRLFGCSGLLRINHTTLKFLVGIAPHGSVTFVSSLYQGSISDKEITRRSGVLSLRTQEGDEVMANKGFLIQDSLEHQKATLAISPFLSRTRSLQFSSKEVTGTQQIGRLRIHVGRAIRRNKEYNHIFDKVLPLSLAGSVNQIRTICCLLTNFRGPLYWTYNRNFTFPSKAWFSNMKVVAVHRVLVTMCQIKVHWWKLFIDESCLHVKLFTFCGYHFTPLSLQR